MPPLSERLSALKERVYASFTGIAIVTVFALDPSHTTAQSAFFALLAGIVGITLAGFVAEVISHLVAQCKLPGASELREMARIALGAIASASLALLSLAAAWIGILDVEIALRVSVGIYLLTLGAIAMLAAHRSGLPWGHKLVALGGLVGLGIVVVTVLVIAH